MAWLLLSFLLSKVEYSNKTVSIKMITNLNKMDSSGLFTKVLFTQMELDMINGTGSDILLITRLYEQQLQSSQKN